MIIHLVRHAEAIERSPEILEEHRYLTTRGRTRFRKIAAQLKKDGIAPDLILSSPLIRAVQTAEILAQAIKFKKELLLTPLLAHGFTKKKLDELLGQYPKAREIALVGHEPELGEVARALLEVKQPCALEKGATISFKLKGPGTPADFRRLVDGGAKSTKARGKALKRLAEG